MASASTFFLSLEKEIFSCLFGNVLCICGFVMERYHYALKKRKMLWNCLGWWLYYDILEGLVCYMSRPVLKYVENYTHTSFMSKAILSLCHEEEKWSRKQAE